MVDGLPPVSSLGPRRNFSKIFGFDFETGKFIFALGAIPGKIYVKDLYSLNMSSICWPSLENEKEKNTGHDEAYFAPKC